MITERYEYKPINRVNVDGKRYYATPTGNKLPSVTTILDRTKPEEQKQALRNWKKRVGEKKAQEIVTEAASRGTRMHAYLERFVKEDDLGEFPTNPYAQTAWFMAAEVVLKGMNSKNEYWGCEVPVYYDGLYAGTTDCVGVWNGRPAIIDFKQTNKPKKREWIGDYFLQLTAYAQAHNEMHGTDINTGVILMCAKPESKDATPQYQEFVLEADEFDHWSEQWMKRVELYYQIA